MFCNGDEQSGKLETGENTAMTKAKGADAIIVTKTNGCCIQTNNSFQLKEPNGSKNIASDEH